MRCKLRGGFFQTAVSNLHRRLAVCAKCRAMAWNVRFDARAGLGHVVANLLAKYGVDLKGQPRLRAS